MRYVSMHQLRCSMVVWYSLIRKYFKESDGDVIWQSDLRK